MYIRLSCLLNSLIVVAFCLLSSFEVFAASAKTSERLIDRELRKIQAGFATFNFQQVQMDFNGFLRQLSFASDPQKSKSQIKQLESLLELANSLKPSMQTKLGFCQTLVLDDLKTNILLAKQRAELVSRFSKSPNYTGSFYTFIDRVQGKLWYEHWLKSWLLADVSTDELKRIAQRELDDVKLRRARITQSTIAIEMAYKRAEKKKIISAFRKREQIVSKNVKAVIGTSFNASPVKIVESSLPKSFPAPGIYNPITSEFIYHLQSNDLPSKHMDWLYLHEAVPGHHYQNQFLAKQALCESYPQQVESTVFGEGWAAYIETLGSDLGLYSDTASLEYAFDWQALRAVRVLLDIGIHAEGWTDAQAQEIWVQYIPEQKEIMEREIARIRRWPVQVITYVYGKAKILDALAQLKQSRPDKPVDQLRREILTLSNYSLNSLALWSNKLSDQLTANQSY